VSTAIEVACEQMEDLLDAHPELEKRAVFWSSDLVPQLLFPQLSLDGYEGPEGGLFAFVEDAFGARSPFVELLEEEETFVDGTAFASDVEKLLKMLLDHRASIPPVFAVSKANGETFDELQLGGAVRIQCGYDHCVLIDDEESEAIDLREETEVVSDDSRLKILRLDTVALIEPELRNLMQVARTAVQYGCRIEMRVV
jgi:hypothetical protein